jgi:MFS family permease
MAVRVPGVWSRPFWEDEAASAQILHEPTLWAALRRVVRTESTPPLWYVLAWAVHQLGVPFQDERLLSVLFGGVFAALVVVLARRFVGIALAVLAGLLTALGSEFVKHGHELRSYELFASLAALLGLVLILELDSPSRRREVALALTVAAGGLTHFFFAFLVIAVLAWLWLDPGARAIRVRATCAIAAGCAVALTWLPLLLAQYHPWRFSWIGSFRWRPVVAVPLRLFTTADSGTLDGRLLSAAAAAVLAVGCVRLARASAAGRLVAVLAVAPLVAAAAVWAAGMPIFDLRNQIGMGAFVAVAFVAAVDALPMRVALVTAGAVLAAMALAVATATPAIRAYNVIARRLVAAGWSGSQPIAVFGDPYAYRTPLEWYLPHQPSLTFASPRAASCANVFLVRPGGRVVPTTLGATPTIGHVTLLLSASADRRCLHKSKTASVNRDATAHVLRLAR